MATFKAEVQRHQRRRDGLYPVSIRVTTNRQVVRIPMGLYASESQIHKKTFEIKDRLIIGRTNETIEDYREKLLELSTDDLANMSAADLKHFLSVRSVKVDYLDFCDRLIASNAPKIGSLRSAVSIIRDMGYVRMPVTEFNSKFIRKFKEYIDGVEWVEKKSGKTRKYRNGTKNGLIVAIVGAFNRMKDEYNSDFHTVIKHNVSYEFYQVEDTISKALTVEAIRAIAEYEPRTDSQRKAKDICLLSFGLCGVNVEDLINLKKESYLKDFNRIYYRRSKTGIRTSAIIPKQIEDLFNRYYDKDGDRLFSFYKYYNSDENIAHLVGAAMTTIGKRLGIGNVTSYSFRHSWATIARNILNADKDDIDTCIAHASGNKMADVYIKSEWDRFDKISIAVMEYVFGDKVCPVSAPDTLVKPKLYRNKKRARSSNASH